jgi:hypothetical protein
MMHDQLEPVARLNNNSVPYWIFDGLVPGFKPSPIVRLLKFLYSFWTAKPSTGTGDTQLCSFVVSRVERSTMSIFGSM